MKQNFCKLFFLVFVALAAKNLKAQESQSDSTEKNKAEFKISINYNSNLNYFGRTDSLKSSGVFPLLEFWATKNVYINAAPVFVNNEISSFDYAGTVASIGYQFTSKNEKWMGNFYLLKPFYEENSQLVQSALKAQSGASFTNLNKILNFTIGGDVKLSDNIDFGATAGIDHIIRIENSDNSVIVFDPSFYAYAGTQRFTHTYQKRNSGNALIPGSQQQITESVNSFNILAYEFSMPLIFAKGKFMFLATPSYVIPQNLITVQDRPDLSEKGQNMFYATLGAKFSF